MRRFLVLLVAAETLLRCIPHLQDTCVLNGASLSNGSSIPLQINLLIKQSSQAFFSGPENCLCCDRVQLSVFLLTSSLSLKALTFLVCVCSLPCAFSIVFFSLSLSLSFSSLSLSLFLSLPLPPFLPFVCALTCLLFCKGSSMCPF